MNHTVVAIEGPQLFVKLQPDQSAEAIVQTADIRLSWDPALELWRVRRCHLVSLVECLDELGYDPRIASYHESHPTWAREMFGSMGTAQLKRDAHLALLNELRESSEETERLEHVLTEALAFELFGDKFL